MGSGSGPINPLRGHSDDLADALYRRVLGWPTSSGPRSDADIVRDLRELVAERARRRAGRLPWERRR